MHCVCMEGGMHCVCGGGLFISVQLVLTMADRSGEYWQHSQIRLRGPGVKPQVITG